MSASAASRSCWSRWACSSWARSISTRCSHVAAAIRLLGGRGLQRRELAVRSACELGVAAGLGRFESRRPVPWPRCCSVAGRRDFVFVGRTLLVVGLHLVGDALGRVGRLFELAAGGGGALAMFGEFCRELGWLWPSTAASCSLFAGAIVFEPGVDSVLMGELLFQFGELFLAGAKSRCGARAGRPTPVAGRRRACRRR